MNNDKLTTIYMVRHGQSEANANGEIPSMYVKGESPLTELGKKQAAEFANKLRTIHFDKIYTSQLSRAHETAQIIAQTTKTEVIQVVNIHERIFGSNFNSYTKEQRQIIEGPASTLTEDDVMNFRYSDDGETAGESYKRFKTFVDKIIEENKGKSILVVNHGNNMRWFLIKLGYATFKELPPGTIENCGYYVIETDGKNFTVKEAQGVNKVKTN